MENSDLDDLVRNYLAGATLKELGERYGTHRTAIARLLRKNGVNLRSGSEARRLCWSKYSPDQRVKQITAAHAATAGRGTPMESRIKAAATRQAKLLGTAPNEIAVAESLRGLGYKIDRQLAVGPYSLDIAVEELGLAVEIERVAGQFRVGKNRPGDVFERTKHVLGSGWSVLFVVTGRVGVMFPNITQKILAYAEVAGRGKTYWRHYGMVRGDGSPCARNTNDLDGLPRVPGF